MYVTSHVFSMRTTHVYQRHKQQWRAERCAFFNWKYSHYFELLKKKKKKKLKKRAHPEDSEPVDLVTFSKDLNINIHNFI